MEQTKLQRIIDCINNEGITAYEIGQNTSLTEYGVLKILKGNIKRPHNSTLDILSQYLFEKAQISQNWLATGEAPKKTIYIPSDNEQSKMSRDEVSSKMDEIAVFIAKNERAMLENEVFRNLIERKSYELAIKLIKDEGWKK